MKRHRRIILFSICTIWVVIVISPAQADIITIEGTVKSVDAKKRTITIETGTKEKTLDLSSKVNISIDEKVESLESLSIGQKLSLSYHDQLEVVVSIEVHADNSNWTYLFNGNDLQGWRFQSPVMLDDSNLNASQKPDGLWFIDAERHVLVSLGKESCWIETEEKFKDFHLSCEWRFLPGRQITDSGGGIVVRASGRNLNRRNPRGIEIDLLPADKPGLGSFLLYGSPLENKDGKAMGENNVRLKRIHEPRINPEGQWNTCEISCLGDRVEVEMNGAVVNEAWGARDDFGTICLRNQSTEMEYRNIRIRTIEVKPVQSGDSK